MSQVRHRVSRFTSLAAAALCALALQSAGAGEQPLAISATDPGLQWGPCPPFFSAGCRLGVLRGDPAGPNADVLFKVPGGDILPNHRHTSAERMVLLQGELQVQYQGHEAVTLRPGMYAYGPAGAPHRGQCLSESPCVLFIAFEQPVDAHLAE